MARPDCVTESKGRVVLEVFVQPRAARDAIGGLYGTALKVKTTAPPTDGRANAAVEGLIADWLGIPARRVSVISGAKSRRKRLALTGPTMREVSEACEAVLHSDAHERR